MFSSAIKSVHFTGIGGTAMASAAAAMLDKGFAVTGSDQNLYEPMASFLAANPAPVSDYRAGKAAALNSLKGQVMKLSKGKANPALVGEILGRKLKV